MVKNKNLPDLAAHPQSGLSLSLSLSLSLPRRLGPIKAGLTSLLSPTPFILKVPPGSCRGWTLAGKGTLENYIEPQKTKSDKKKSPEKKQQGINI